MRYLGWISAKRNQRHQLTKLGVEGKIKYNEEAKCFFYCNCSEDIVKRLVKEFEGFYAGAFTAVDRNKKQAPRHMQKFW